MLLNGHTADEFIMADAYEFVHRSSGHVLGDDDGARDTEDGAKAGLAVLIGDLGKVFLCICECASHGGERSKKSNGGLLPTATREVAHVSAPYLEGHGDNGPYARRRVCD